MKDQSGEVSCRPFNESLNLDGMKMERMKWDILITIYPVFKKALPRNDGLSGDLFTQNKISKIRQGILTLKLVIPHRDLEQQMLDDPKFQNLLCSLLTSFESLVSDDIFGDIKKYDMSPKLEGNESQENKLQTKFKKILAMKNALRGTVDRKAAIQNLAKSINFRSSPKPKVLETVTNTTKLRSVVEKLYEHPNERVKMLIENTTELSDDEITFIQRAYNLNKQSKDLHKRLQPSTECSRDHEVEMHFSGFLTSESCFELLIKGCGKDHWSSAKCRWVDAPEGTTESYQAAQVVCSQQILTSMGAAPGHWNEEFQELQDKVLLDLKRPLEITTLKPRQKQALEFRMACSLLNLVTTDWIRLGLGIDKISVAGDAAGPLALKPYVKCSLGLTNDNDDKNDDENAAILSFGILLMELQARKTAEPKEGDKMWHNKGSFSRDSILSRILEDWADVIGDDEYKAIGEACLHFRQLSDKFYNQSLTGDADDTNDMNRIGAIYKYIIAPLSRIMVSRWGDFVQLSNDILEPLHSRIISSGRRDGDQKPTSALVLFDGFTIPIGSESSKQIADAKTFMSDLEKVTDRISKKAKSPTVYAHSRQNNIKIAILDTGIDSEKDVLIGTSIDEGRIKKRCGFVDDAALDSGDDQDYQDSTGHGTHVTRLILTAAPLAEVFIAKISNEPTVIPQNLRRIAMAIKWAVAQKVDIISMSFGLDDEDEEIDMAIEAATRANITIFAAAANSGGNKPRAYPSRKTRGVLCIHASDGMGNDGGISPTPMRGVDNFSTLGIAIESRWKGETIYISGTSYATPIAAALAANALEFARHKCSFSDHYHNKLRTFDGVRAMLKLMIEKEAKKRGGYDYIMPFQLWSTNRLDKEVAEEIKKAVKAV